MTTTNYKNLAHSVNWLYGKGHAARIATIDNDGCINVIEQPSELRFWYALCCCFDNTDADMFDYDWSVYDYEQSRFVTKPVKIWRNGRADIML